MTKLLSDMLMSAFGAALVTFPYQIIHGTIQVNSKKESKEVRKAIERGHVVTARLVDHHFDMLNQTQTEMRYRGTYEYEWDGKSYKTHLYYDSFPAEEVTLYFVSDPRRAMTERGFKTSLGSAAKLFGIVFAVLFLIFVFDI